MSLEKYGARHAEPEMKLAAKLTGIWDHAVALPLVDEEDLYEALLESLDRAARHAGRKAIAILVVNHRPDHPDTVKAANFRTLQRLGGAGLRPASAHLDLLVVDRVSPGREFPLGEGVGLARKIGGDIALGLKAGGKLRSRFFSTTDGDVRVGNDYFNVDRLESVTWGVGTAPVAAIVHPYAHVFLPDEDPIGARALRLYEIFLRYYVEGLRFAGSPYAFPTIGSTLTISLEAYAQVRGFPKLLAAEDFYILSKLAAVGNIHIPRGAKLDIRQRPSDRVPFGTGKSMEKIGETLRQSDAYTLYHPEIFSHLRETLRAFGAFAHHRDLSRVKEELARGPAGEPRVELLTILGAFRALEVAQRTRKRPQDIWRHVHTWFDALKTLKFTHGMRDRGWANVDYRTAVRAFARGETDEAILEDLRRSAERAGGWEVESQSACLPPPGSRPESIHGVFEPSRTQC